jgi:hypothetical protein
VVGRVRREVLLGGRDARELGLVGSALRAWADTAIERPLEDGCRGRCDLSSLAGELNIST